MADLQGVVIFPGIAQPLGGEMTLSKGHTPSYATIYFPAQEKEFSPKPSTLTFRYGPTEFTFKKCIIDSGQINYDPSGQIWQLRVLDRRWAWKYGEINGRYNYRRQDGTLDKTTEKTPRELAKLLFEAMGPDDAGPSAAQIEALPNDSRPEVDWRGANPAAELSALCDQFACCLVFGLDDKARICQNGKGKELPLNPLAISGGFGLKVNVAPKSITILCGPTKFQGQFVLEAIAEDVDGKDKPIDELSYKPADGWWGEDPLTFAGVTKVYERKLAGQGIAVPLIEEDTLDEDDPDVLAGKYGKCRDLALRDVFRKFRVKELREGGFTPKGYAGEKIKSIKQLLPLDDVQVTTSLAVVAGEAADTFVKRSKPATVEGIFWRSVLDENSVSDTIYPGSFSIDGEKGVVQFSDPVTRLVPSDVEQDESAFFSDSLPVIDHGSPVLYLTTSFELRDNDGAKVSFRSKRTLKDGEDTETRIVRHDEILHTVRTTYNKGEVLAVIDNKDDVTKECKHYLDALEKEYTDEPSTDFTYAGLFKIEPDGAIQQVTWRVGNGQPATTRASRNQDHSFFTPSFQEIRRRERLAFMENVGPAVARAAGAAFDLLRRFIRK